jgi:hypothetical protein
MRSFEPGNVWSINFTLIEGDAMEPSGTDIIMARGRLNVGSPVPDGWRVLSGTQRSSDVVAVGFRFEMEEWRRD